MRRLLVVTCVLLCAAAASAGGAREDIPQAGRASFTRAPAAVREGTGARITFAVSAPTDVEVAVLDAKGGVVRHLAAGLLGKNPPAPLRADALEQSIVWDGNDDQGRPAAGGPFKARVRLGSKVTLERYLGRSGQATGDFLPGVAVAESGEVYVLMSNLTYGRSEIRALDRDGKYLRTVMPYPAGTPEAQLKDLGRLEVGGETLPIVFDAHAHSVQPLTAGMNRQSMLVHPKGHLVLASAVGTITNHGPPRYLLALDPRGGAPEGVRHVGPQILKPRGMLGGTGESGATCYDGIAASPDGEWLYVTTSIESGSFNRIRRHAVWRVRWTDASLGEPFLGQAEAGTDDAHFNEPQGVATDAAGRIYVCDRGNNRVMVFSADGTLAGRFAVDQPQQIAVHPKTASIYVVSRAPGQATKLAGTTLRKFAAWQEGTTRELIKQDFDKRAVDAFAIDPASPARLWMAMTVGWRRHSLIPVTERDGSFVLGESALDATSGLRYPMFVHADGPRGRLYVTEMHDGVCRIDLATGGLTQVFRGSQANEAVPAADGNLFVSRGWQLTVFRADPAGKPVDLASGAKQLGPWAMPNPLQEEDEWARSKGPQVGDRGHVVAPNGDLYILLMTQYRTGRIDVYGPDGTLKKQGLIENVPHGSSGLGVDAAGNVYLGVNLRPLAGPLFPHGFEGKAPAEPWIWWRSARAGMWAYPYFNTYLYHWGAVLKFSPKGGRFYTWGRDLRGVTTKPAVPADAVEYRSGYLNLTVAVEGAQWHYAGCGPVPAAGLNWGDPSCTCNNSRLAVDGFGRVYAPDVFRFSVEMLDANGNQLARIGRYGNADSAGPGSRAPQPDIAFAWPAFVSVAGDDLYVCDPVNRRVAQLKVRADASQECAVP